MFGFGGGNEAPKLATLGVTPINTLEKRLLQRESELTQCFDRFNKLSADATQNEPPSPLAAGKTQTLDAKTLPKKEHWKISPNAILEDIIIKAREEMKGPHQELRELNIILTKQSSTDRTQTCLKIIAVTQKLVSATKKMVNEICIFLLECRTVEEIFTQLLIHFNLKKVDELFERALFKLIQTNTEVVENLLAKLQKDFAKTENLIVKDEIVLNEKTFKENKLLQAQSSCR